MVISSFLLWRFHCQLPIQIDVKRNVVLALFAGLPAIDEIKMGNAQLRFCLNLTHRTGKFRPPGRVTFALGGKSVLLRYPKFRSGLKAAEILTAATRSPRFICHRQRSDRSPKTPLKPAV